MFDSLELSSAGTMLAKVHALMDEADVIVHYNGLKFDVPTLNQEFITHGMKPPSPAHQIDLYRVVKKNFRFPSYKMDYVATELGLGHKTRHKGMDLWKGCMANEASSWDTMETYNKQDVKLLARLYKSLLPWIQNHPNHALFTGKLDRPSCPNCGSTHVESRGIATTKTGLYKRYQCECGKWLRGRLTQVDKTVRENILVGV